MKRKPLTSASAKAGSPAPGYKPFFSVKDAADGPAEISIYDQIGRDYWSGEGIGAKQFAESLKEVPKSKEILLRINSPGGAVHDGMAIYNLMAERRDKVDVVVDGVACSIASVIAMCGRTLKMPANTLMMVHNPFGVVQGDAEDMRQAAVMLDKHRDAIVAVYVKRTGKSEADIKALMDDETWMTGEEAKESGFCDEVTNKVDFQARFEYSGCTRVPECLKKPAQGGGENTQQAKDKVNKTKLIAALRKRGIEVQDDISDEALMALFEEHLSAPAATNNPPRGGGAQTSGRGRKPAAKKPESSSDSSPDPDDAGGDSPTNRLEPDAGVAAMQADLAMVKSHLAAERKGRISSVVDQCIAEDRVPAAQREKWVTRALADETVLDDLRAMDPRPPGSPAPGVLIIGEAPRDIERGIVALRAPLRSWLKGNLVDAKTLSASSIRMARELSNPKTRQRLESIMNANTIDEDLKRNVILNDIMRAFKRRIVMLQVFSTKFTNVPLEGTNKVEMPFYELDTTPSKDFNTNVGYVFDEDTSVGKRDITIDQRKYKSMDFSSETFRRQPYFNPPMSMLMKTEQLALDVWLAVLGIVTQSNFGPSVLSVEPGVFDVDDVTTIDKACNDIDWPEIGRTLVLGTGHKASLLQDNTLKFFSHAGDDQALRAGSTGRLLNFDMVFSPRIPSNGEDLGGFACLPQAILVATAPIAPAPGVRARLLSYDLVTDPDTGIAFEYRYWGEAQADKDNEVVEVNFGFKFGNAKALKRVTDGASTNSSSSSASSVNSSSSSSST